MDLVEQLVGSLGVQENQAKGGAGLLLQMAQSKLGDSDFEKVAAVIPGASDLISAAPSANDGGGGMMGALGGMAAKMGAGGDMGDLLSLAGGFSKLDMDSSMVSKFVPVVMQFVQQKGGSDVAGLLSNILK